MCSGSARPSHCRSRSARAPTPSCRVNCWNSCASSGAATIPGWMPCAIRLTAARPIGPLTNGTYLDARGGWHDAADLLKYLLTSGNATAQMLLAYQLGEAKSEIAKPDFTPLALKADLQRPGQPYPNGMPDMLDEARWGLEWMLKLHPAPDQLYHQVADDRDHTGRRLPQNENVDYGWGKGGRAGGVFRRRPAAGVAAIQERVHGGGESGGALRRGDGAGLPDLEGRPAPAAICRAVPAGRQGGL